MEAYFETSTWTLKLKILIEHATKKYKFLEINNRYFELIGRLGTKIGPVKIKIVFERRRSILHWFVYSWWLKSAIV